MKIDRKGMTLVEVIVTLVLVMLFIGCSIAVIMPVMKVYNRTTDMADDQSLATNIADTISQKVYYGSIILISEDGKSLTVDQLHFNVQDGYLKEGDNYVFDPIYYNGATCDIDFAYENYIVTIDVTIIRENKQGYNYILDAKPLMFLNNDNPEEPGEGYDVGDVAFTDSKGNKVYLSGNWQKAKENAVESIGNGINLVRGTVYKDHTGVYAVVWDEIWLPRSEGLKDISCAEYPFQGLQKIDTNSDILTLDDIGYSSEFNSLIWMKVPVEGSLCLVDGDLYVCAVSSGIWTARNVTTRPDIWIKLIQ